MYKDIKDKLLAKRRIRKAKIGLHKLIIPGFDGLPLMYVLSFFFKGLTNGAVTMRAAALSYNFFMSLFPTIIFFFTLIPYIPIDGFQQTLMTLLQNIIPKDAFNLTSNALSDIIMRQNGGLLSLGFVLALLFSTNGIVAFMNAFNATYHSVENRKFLKKRLVALVLVIIIALIVITTIVLISGASWVMKSLYLNHYCNMNTMLIVLKLLKWLILLSMFFLAISFLYYIAPAKSDKFRFISAGSSLSTLLTVVTSLGFNYYISNFSSYNKLYGSIGALIIFLLWIYSNVFVILIGYELNTSINQARKQKELS